MELRGIDVSKWNRQINWKKVKNSGIEFAIIREGFGVKSPKQTDEKLKENIAGAKNAGISVGVYHYCYANSVQEAIDEAHFCLENIQGYQLEFPVVLDVEDNKMLKLTTRQRTDNCKAFCEEIEKNGYYTMIYTNLNWIKNYLYVDELFSKYDLWLAQWNCENPSYSCGIWQYSETGKVDGINGNVDLNISYKNYPEIIKNNGLNGFKPNIENFNNQNKLSNKNLFISHTVNIGENLWIIAERMLGNGNRYKEIKDINNLSSDIIYPGQTLKIPKAEMKLDYKTHIVKDGETLWSIAEKHLGSGNKYKEIKKINGLDHDTIYPGQVLKI